MKDLDDTQPRANASGAHADADLRVALRNSANRTGGWPYYTGKSSRLEPTCWALIALGVDGLLSSERTQHRDFLARAQQSSGWLTEDPHVPVNIGFNALVAALWLMQPDLASDAMRSRLLSVLVASKGVQAPPLNGSTQNNALQGWSWIDATFSWVEPTAWALIALKTARRQGSTDHAAAARIDEGDRLLIDRCCKDGGWNFGNASMMHQDLRPYVPTTALALIALHDRRDEAAVTRSLQFLEQHWRDELSAIALGLSTICLATYGRPTGALETRLRVEASKAIAFGSIHGIATTAAGLGATRRVLFAI